MKQSAEHLTVLKTEAVAALAVRSVGNYLDATFGRGGHSKAILEQLGDSGKLLVIDKDPEAIAVAEQFADQHANLKVIHGSFSELSDISQELKLEGELAGILFDLGVSSPQLDDAGRGFSFMHDGPLDMRMNPEQGMSAREWINSAKEKEIADVLYEFGEERHSRRMARRIVLERQESPMKRLAVWPKSSRKPIPPGKKTSIRLHEPFRVSVFLSIPSWMI